MGKPIETGAIFIDEDQKFRYIPWEEVVELGGD